MKTLTRNILRTAITVILVILAFVAIFRAWVYYTASPWTRDARFSADIVAIAPDVSGLISQVNVKDNQLVKKDQVLFVIDQPRYQKALAQAEADVAYYQTLAQEKRVEAGRRNKLGVQAMSRKRLIRRTTYCKPLNISWRKRWLVATWPGWIWSGRSFAPLRMAG